MPRLLGSNVGDRPAFEHKSVAHDDVAESLVAVMSQEPTAMYRIRAAAGGD